MYRHRPMIVGIRHHPQANIAHKQTLPEGTWVGGVRQPDSIAPSPLPPNAPNIAAGDGARAQRYDATAPRRWRLPGAAQQTPHLKGRAGRPSKPSMVELCP